MGRSLGQHLADRLKQIGVDHFFSVPGDYNLPLLDELMKDGVLEGRWCCNELNAGYAADGYARANGVGCVVVTYTVGGLSAINAIAGAYAENQAVVCIVGAPNSNDLDGERILHHTMGVHNNVQQEVECFRHVTAYSGLIRSLDDAHAQIDEALSIAVRERKPVYLGVPSNLGPLNHPSFDASPVPFSLVSRPSNPEGLRRAVRVAADFLATADKPVLVVGSLVRSCGAVRQAVELGDASGYGIAALAAAKGLVPEDHEGYIGTYWGSASSQGTAELVESADAHVLVGAVLSDYATAGYSLNLSKARAIQVEPYRVVIQGGKGGHSYGCVRMGDFLTELAKVVKRNELSREIFSRLKLPKPQLPPAQEGAPLETRRLFAQVQRALDPNTILIGETGDSIFNCQKLELPNGASYEWAQQYGSIGWSVGATLGASVAAAHQGRRVVSCIGDGSFQVTAQDVSSMLRFCLNPIIFLINNDGYTIEKEIHDGPKANNYNMIQPWDYVAFAKAVHNGHGKLFATKCTTEAELVAAVDASLGEHKYSLCFLECVVDPHDCSPELLEWGSRVAANNARPPAGYPA